MLWLSLGEGRRDWDEVGYRGVCGRCPKQKRAEGPVGVEPTGVDRHGHAVGSRAFPLARASLAGLLGLSSFLGCRVKVRGIALAFALVEGVEERGEGAGRATELRREAASLEGLGRRRDAAVGCGLRALGRFLAIGLLLPVLQDNVARLPHEGELPAEVGLVVESGTLQVPLPLGR